MTDINFFDMTKSEMMKYYQDPENNRGYNKRGFATNLETQEPLKTAYPKNDNPFSNMSYKEEASSFDFFGPKKLIAPQLYDIQRHVNRENVATQKKRVRDQLRQAENLSQFDPMNVAVPRTPEALAKDLNIQQLLSEAETMIRRYNLPQSSADALKIDIMRSHLPDFVTKKASLSQKQQDEMLSKIMKSIDPEHDVGETFSNNTGLPDSVKTVDPRPGSVQSTPGVGGSAGGGDLGDAVEPQSLAQVLVNQMVGDYREAGELFNPPKQEYIIMAARAIKDFQPSEILDFVYNAKPSRPPPERIQLRNRVQSYLQNLFGLGGDISSTEITQFSTVITNMKRIINSSFFKVLDIPSPSNKLVYETFKKL